MKAATLKYWILSKTAVLSMVLLALMPFHAFLTVWLASGLGHYTALRLWKEVLLLVIGLGVIYLVLADRHVRAHTLTRKLVWLTAIYLGVQLVWGLIGYYQGNVTLKALGYGLIVNSRFPLFFLLTWAIALRTQRLRANWRRLVLWPAAVVVAFGLLQLLLPNDFLRHFGYSPATIAPYVTVNSNTDYIRIASTLRGANPLGAYLIIPISVLAVLILKEGKRRLRLLGLAAAFWVLFFSFSRSAGLAALVVLALATVLGRPDLVKKLAPLAAAAVLISMVLAFALQNNSRFQNLVFHTEDRSKVATSSNQGHIYAMRTGLNQIARQPLGSGVGTAGPASVYNSGHPTRVAENYFIQIGQETGVIGLGLFVVMNAGLGYLLWLRRSDTLALSLLTSLVGLTLVNMFLHAWADDTLAYLWWGLAGIAMAPIIEAVKPVYVARQPDTAGRKT